MISKQKTVSTIHLMRHKQIYYADIVKSIVSHVINSTLTSVRFGDASKWWRLSHDLTEDDGVAVDVTLLCGLTLLRPQMFWCRPQIVYNINNIVNIH
jgi:hypothetical protein